MTWVQFKQWLTDLFPRIPPGLDDAFEEFQRQLARRVAVVGAVAVLIILPAFQAIEFFLYDDPQLLGLRNGLWRLPVMVAALAILALRWGQPEGSWPRPMVLLLGFAMVFMMVGIFANDQVYDGAPIQYTSQGLIITLAAVSVAATRGLRDVPLIYGLPVLALPFLLLLQGASLGEAAINLLYPMVMVLVACLIAELIYHGNVHAFMSHQQMRSAALTDPLTGLWNRRAMQSELAAAHGRARRQGGSYCALFADIDRFKGVNDTYGHDVGDQVLLELARRIRQSVRVEDRVARWGGEEFLILLQDCDRDQGWAAAENVRRTVEQEPFPTTAGLLPITISLGLAVTDGQEEPVAAVNRADEALYAAKTAGRNRTEMAG